MGDDSSITVYLINSVTGRVIHSFSENNVVVNGDSSPLASVFSENLFALAFHRMNGSTGIAQQELTVVEMFEKKQEDDTLKLLKDYLKGSDRISSPSFSSFTEESSPEIL